MTRRWPPWRQTFAASSKGHPEEISGYGTSVVPTNLQRNLVVGPCDTWTT
jgi:hypothetical protein